MSKKKDIVNEIQGSIGDFVIYKRYGKTFLRSRPKTMNHPNSDAQLEQRHKFSMSNTLAKNYRVAVGHVSVETDEPKSPYNSMIGLIRRSGFKGKYPDITWNWETIEFSEGSLALPKDLRISETASLIQLEWNHAETNEQGTVFLIGVNTETLHISVVTDAQNSGKLSLVKAEGHHYFAFKEWINNEKTLKSGTKRYLQNSELTFSVIETPIVEDKPIVLEDKEIVSESEEIHDDGMESVRGLEDINDDGMESVRGLEDINDDISFDPSEFGEFSRDSQNEDTEIESETESKKDFVGTVGIVEPEIVYNPDEFTGFEKLESPQIKEEAVVEDSIITEVVSEEIEEHVEEFVSEQVTEEVAELEEDLVEDVVDETVAELEPENESVGELEVIEELVEESFSELETEEVAELEEDLVEDVVDELFAELEPENESVIEIETVAETSELIEKVVVEVVKDEEVKAQGGVKEVETPEPKVIKEEKTSVSKVHKEKNAKKTLVEKAISSKEDEMRNQLSLF